MAKKHTPETRQRILDTMRQDIPFIALCAEKCGVSRFTMNTWLDLGKNGHPDYEDFTSQVYQIRAEFMLKMTQECMSTTKETAEAAKQRNWLLARLDRSLFDPPKEVYEKVLARASQEKHAASASAADPNAVAQAIQALTSH